MKLLFVYKENIQRSPNAEDLFKGSKKHDVRYAGTSYFAVKRINKKDIKWVDKIFVMEQYHQKYIEEKYPLSKEKEIIVLNIPDIYYRNDPELINILKEKLKEYLPNSK